jgi:GT2 family glycosyltransferase
MIDRSLSATALAEPGGATQRTAPTLAIVIAHYNTSQLLAGCLASIAASQITIPLRVVVVDNASTDESLVMLARDFPWVAVIASPHNGGFAYANNLALRQLIDEMPPEQDRHHAYLLLLNPDTVLAPDSLVQMVDFLETHPEAGVVGPKLVLPDGRLDLACRRLFPTPRRAFFRLLGLSRLFPRSRWLAGYNLTFLDPDETCEVDSVVGAFMLVRLAAVDQAGLLDEDYFLYGEDLDWAYRIKQHGWRVFYAPLTTVVHHKGSASRQRSMRSIVDFYRAMATFHRKHYARSLPGLVNWLILAGIVARGGLALALNALRPADRRRVT